MMGSSSLRISLSSNLINAEGGALIGETEMLKVNFDLLSKLTTSISLDSTKGAVSIGKSLKDNHSLTELS